MEVIASLATATGTARTSSSPACSYHVYWKRCFICQSIKRPAKKFPLSQASAEGIERVVECAAIREKCNDLSFQDTIDRLKNVNLSESDKKYFGTEVVTVALQIKNTSSVFRSV
jgi:hypothetical protein